MTRFAHERDRGGSSTTRPTQTAKSPAVPADLRGLCLRLREGDPDAFETLYRAWYSRVYAIARAASRRDESFCLDVVQDVMLRVARSLPPLATEGELGAWMAKTTMSVCIDQSRRESRRARREAESAGRGRDARHASPDELAWLAERISQLPGQDYELVMARLAQDRSLREAGLAAGISENAAHGRVRRTVQRLREAARSLWL